MTLAERLRQLRKLHGYRLRTIAATCGLSISHISDVERGRVSPSLDSCQRLAECYGLDLQRLFIGVHSTAPSDAKEQTK